jgi:D-alanyl-lipoteichoic acid acyltransferase DltB (MBOAT superfamily)
LIFNSLAFLLFFPLVVAGYFALPHRARWAWLLAASCYFYMAFVPKYILILGFTILVDYVAGRLIWQATGPRRACLLAASIAANLGVLFFFKYFNFFNTNLASLAGWLHWNYPLHVLAYALPIGLSFHVFQSLSYTIEVYRGNQMPERHAGIFALYVMFFPQLVAGPIERPQNMLHQFHERHDFDADRAIAGLERMLWGFFKKCVVADRLAVLINPVFADPHAYGGPALLLAVLGFTVQIYCDFSGYSDIALGSARVMGFKLMENFDRPYAAASVAEFWTRWHRSLSTWFRDYLYIPLGGNRVGPLRWGGNILVVFLASGLWHGANWTFVIWGALHAAYLVVERALGGRLGRLPHVARVGLTFALVACAWIFFRATSLADANYIVAHLPTGWGAAVWPEAPGEIALAAVAAVLVLALEGRPLPATPWVRWLGYQALVFAVVFLGVFQSLTFIYFQF